MDSEPIPGDRTADFLGLLNAHERALTLYVQALMPADAEDILQQTRMLLWKHFDSFEPGTNFLAWARKMAFHQVLGHRRKKKRFPQALSEESLEALSEAVVELSLESGARHEALRDCVQSLPDAHRQLVDLRYYKEWDVAPIALELGRTETAVYRALSRIRATLMDCVNRKLGKMEA